MPTGAAASGLAGAVRLELKTWIHSGRRFQVWPLQTLNEKDSTNLEEIISLECVLPSVLTKRYYPIIIFYQITYTFHFGNVLELDS